MKGERRAPLTLLRATTFCPCRDILLTRFGLPALLSDGTGLG
ncbi:MAG: hypothetical protein ACYCYP_13035 [Leptospirales bacterium]